MVVSVESTPIPGGKREYHIEHTESHAMVGVSTGGAASLEELIKLLKNIPTQTLGYFLILIYVATMFSLATELSPLWMMAIVSAVSMVMFFQLKL